MRKHTEGPWEYDEDFFIHHKGTILAETLYKGFMEHYKDEAEANARLIAAAPELLGALYSMLYLFDNQEIMKVKDIKQIINKVEKVIAKAEGN